MWLRKRGAAIILLTSAFAGCGGGAGGREGGAGAAGAAAGRGGGGAAAGGGGVAGQGAGGAGGNAGAAAGRGGGVAGQGGGGGVASGGQGGAAGAAGGGAGASPRDAALDSPASDGDSCPTGSPADDKDNDGWTVAEGDCNDCDPLINPGAIDLQHPVDGGSFVWGDEDCDGTFGTNALACDTGLPVADVDAADGAKAIDLCQTASTSDRRWGVLSASYVRANGNAFASPGVQIGLESAFGANVQPRSGAGMLVLSTGHARTPSQAGACGSSSCNENATGTAPAGFPQSTASCAVSPTVDDDVALELTLRAPTNATGFAFAFAFYSFEYPQWVCSGFNDEFVALVSPAPAGSANGNVAFDAERTPISANLGFFPSCDPNNESDFAASCSGATCPSPPNPFCPAGPSALAGTGFDVWGEAGSTGWLRSRIPVTGGQTITIRFAIWDSGDQTLDSTVLIDDFQWIAGETVSVATAPF